MKNICVPKKLWRQLRQLKNQWGLTTIPKTITYLINSQPNLHRENLQEIHQRIDELIKAKNLEENNMETF